MHWAICDARARAKHTTHAHIETHITHTTAEGRTKTNATRKNASLPVSVACCWLAGWLFSSSFFCRCCCCYCDRCFCIAVSFRNINWQTVADFVVLPSTRVLVRKYMYNMYRQIYIYIYATCKRAAGSISHNGRTAVLWCKWAAT